MPKLAELLDFGISDTAIEKWEKNHNLRTEPCRSRIIKFLGFDPKLENPTGDSPRPVGWEFATLNLLIHRAFFIRKT